MSFNEKTLQTTNAKQAYLAKTPYSSFKIASSAIAIDSGIVKDLSQQLSFSQADYPVENWWPKRWYESPLTIREAFQYSAVPIYRDLATKIGAAKMKQYLQSFSYGNTDISSGLDNFWLNGSLKISAVEQVNFLVKLFSKDTMLSTRSLSLLKQVMKVEQTKHCTLYAKTGLGPTSENTYLGWYVGVIEYQGNNYAFAANVEGPTFKSVQKKRILYAKQILREFGINIDFR